MESGTHADLSPITELQTSPASFHKGMPNILRTQESIFFFETRPRESVELCPIPVGSDLSLSERSWLLPVEW